MSTYDNFSQVLLSSQEARVASTRHSVAPAARIRCEARDIGEWSAVTPETGESGPQSDIDTRTNRYAGSAAWPQSRGNECFSECQQIMTRCTVQLLPAARDYSRVVCIDH